MKSKLLAVLVATGMMLFLIGCSKEAEVVEPQQIVETEEVEAKDLEEGAIDDEQATLDELASALDGTIWVGMDSQDYSCYSLGFDGNQLGLYSNVEGDEGMEGYWAIGADSLYIYEDEANTNLLYEVPWTYDEENDVMVLNDRAIMAQVEGDITSAGEAMQQYALAAQVGEFLDSTVWAGTDEEGSMVMAFTFENGMYYMGIVGTDGSSAEYSGEWSIDYDSIYLYDESGALLDTLSWDIAEDGSELYFMVDSSQITFGLVQTDADNVEDALAAIAEEISEQ